MDSVELAKAIRGWQSEHPKTDFALGFVPGVGAVYGGATSAAALIDPDASKLEKGLAVASTLPIGALLKGLRKVPVSKIIHGPKGIAENPSIYRRAANIFYGAHGRKNIEVPDVYSIMKKELAEESGEFELRHLLGNEDLYSSYPHMRRMEVSISPGGFGEYGAYNPSTDSIWLNSDLSPLTRKSTLAHEVQHAIQKFEGYGPPFKGNNIQRTGSFYKYLKDLGESEARTVQHRQNWLPDELKAVPFMDHLDAEQRRLDWALSNLKQRYPDDSNSILEQSGSLYDAYRPQMKSPSIMARYIRRYNQFGPKESYERVNPMDISELWQP